MNASMRRNLIGLLALLVTATVTAAPDSASVAGVVTDAVTGGLLEDVTVTASPESFQGKSQTAVTDVSGRFAITGLAPGRYILSAPTRLYTVRGGADGPDIAEQRKYTPPDDTGVHLTLAAGDNLNNVRLPMAPAAIISGRIRNPGGGSFDSLDVVALRFDYREAGWALNSVEQYHNIQGGDRYRIDFLPAGTYFLAATGWTHKGEGPSVRVYYPGVQDPRLAVPIVVGAGANLAEVDFQVAPPEHPAFIRLKVAESSPGARLFFPRFTIVVRRPSRTEMPEGPDVVYATTRNIAPDTYRIGPLSPGPYEILVETGCSDVPPCSGPMGRVKIDIPDQGATAGAADANEIDTGTVNLDSAMKITGTLWTPLPLAQYLQGARGRILPSVTLRAMEGSPSKQIGIARTYDDGGSETYHNGSGRTYSASLNEDGSFSIGSVLAGGRYRVEVHGLPPDLLLQSATFGGRDVLEAGLLVTHDQQATLELSMAAADTFGTVTGSVRAVDGKPAAGALVVLVPPKDRRTYPASFKTAVTDQAGGFSMPGILPGEYQVVAWQDMKPGEFLNPSILDLIDDRFSKVFVRRGSRDVMTLEAIAPAR